MSRLFERERVLHPERVAPRDLSPGAGGLRGLAFAMGLLAAMLFALPVVVGQGKKAPAAPSPFGSANGEFVAAENDNGKIRSVIKGVGASLETEGAGKARVERIRLKQVRLEQYGDDGRTNMIVEGKNCLFDPKTRAASSPDSFRLTTGGGRLVVEGVGFSWYHTNSHLVVSNRVHTVVSGTEALFSPSKTP